jgi:hypothetical protein
VPGPHVGDQVEDEDSTSCISWLPQLEGADLLIPSEQKTPPPLCMKWVFLSCPKVRPRSATWAHQVTWCGIRK